jgi:hypothetical protein
MLKYADVCIYMAQAIHRGKSVRVKFDKHRSETEPTKLSQAKQVSHHLLPVKQQA